jgi:hypothetical protein
MLMVIDSCQSGQLLESADSRQGPMNTKGLAQLAYDKGIYILAASQSYQSALEVSQLGHGLLTYALVTEGLEQFKADFDPEDGRISPREWFQSAVHLVPELALERSVARSVDIGLEPQSPQVPRAFFRRDADDDGLTVRRRE